MALRQVVTRAWLAAQPVAGTRSFALGPIDEHFLRGHWLPPRRGHRRRIEVGHAGGPQRGVAPGSIVDDRSDAGIGEVAEGRRAARRQARDHPLALADQFRRQFSDVDWWPEYIVTESPRVYCGGGVNAASDLSSIWSKNSAAVPDADSCFLDVRGQNSALDHRERETWASLVALHASHDMLD
jgi:hypothetical protein